MSRTEVRREHRPRCSHSCSRRLHRCLLDKKHKEGCSFVCGINLVNSRTRCR